MLIDINSVPHFLFSLKQNKKIIITFYREDDKSSNKISDKVVRTMVKISRLDKFIDIMFLAIDHELFPELVDLYNIDFTPSVLFLYDKKPIRIVDGTYINMLEDYTNDLNFY
jgi:hypothetical protein